MTPRELERRLADTPAGEPPADLLARLRAEIPPRLELAPAPPRRPTDWLRTRRLPPPWLRAAAVVVLALGGAWMLWRLSVPVLAPEAAVEARGAAVRDGEREDGAAAGRADAPAAKGGGGFDAPASGVEGDAGGEAPGASSARGNESLAAEPTAAESIADPMAAEAAAATNRAEAGAPSHADLADRSADAAAPPAPSAARTATPPAGTLPPPAVAPPAAPRQESDRRQSADELATERPQTLAEGRAADDEKTAAGGEARRFNEEVVVEEAAKADRPRRSPAAADIARPSLAPPATGAPTALGALSDRAAPGRPPGVHPFVDAGDDRFSTFGLHVGTGSWRRVQASLRRGALPAATAVRVEEVINALDAGGPAPRGGETFGIAAEGTPSPFTADPRERLLRFALRARQGGLAGSHHTVAEEARVQVEFDPRVVAGWRLLGFEDGDLADDRFRHVDTIEAGEIGAGHTVTALYEIRLVERPAPDRPLVRLTLRYRLPGSGRSAEIERLLRVGDLSPTWEAAPPALRLATVAAELAERLRGSEWAARGDLDDVARHAAALAAERPSDRRAAELAETAARAAELARQR